MWLNLKRQFLKVQDLSAVLCLERDCYTYSARSVFDFSLKFIFFVFSCCSLNPFVLYDASFCRSWVDWKAVICSCFPDGVHVWASSLWKFERVIVSRSMLFVVVSSPPRPLSHQTFSFNSWMKSNYKTSDWYTKALTAPWCSGSLRLHEG